MNQRCFALLGFAVFLFSNCTHSDQHAVYDQNQLSNPLVLEISSLEKLSPYLIDFKPVGNPVITTSDLAITANDVITQKQTIQSYTFSMVVDENNHPVLPGTKEAENAMKRAGGHRNGTVSIGCVGVCFSNNPNATCTISGCDDNNSGGCTPINCGSCQSNGCKPPTGKVLIFGGGVML